ncbi:MAG TPA: helicase C-terminal domain-containing protein [Limnochordia bacterium]|nr:helicase C-terminal domain-containing protein [Limnochordia bacterium]
MEASGAALKGKSLIGQYFGPGGRLAELLPEYEHRREQEEMALHVMRTLSRGDVGLFEAGTGTGKSLAYLIPAALYALGETKPVVVSTYTISLQEQLIGKDIPVVQTIFPDLKAALVKGWRNYLCYLRLETALSAPGDLLEPEHDRELSQIAAWARETEDGTLSDLPFQPTAAVWDEVCAESDSCLRNRCPHFERCPLIRDRTEMASAHLLVVNHHLLFSDVAVRRQLDWSPDTAVLPGYDTVIVDEAHHLEDVATDHLGVALTSRGVAQLFGRIYRAQGGRGRGVVAGLRRILSERGAWERLTRIEQELIPAIHRSEAAVDGVLSLARRWPGERIAGEDAARWQVEAALPSRAAVSEVEALAAMLEAEAQDLESDGEPEGAALTLIAQLRAASYRLRALGMSLQHFSQLDTLEQVYWLEREGGIKEHVRLLSAPIDVGPLVYEWIAAQCRSIVLVSATLTVDRSFRYFKERLGLHGARPVAGRMDVHELSIASPFDYESQALLGIAVDLPDPAHPEYAERLPLALETLVAASRGRALVLFTSIALLERVRIKLAPALRELGLELLAQGEAPRTRLLDAFRRGKGAVLLGTDSFWEGVDVPGEALSLVVLTRLPFDVPTEPISAARSERLQEMGRSPFAEYALPRAVLKLKQGFGRLIRTRADRGAVVILDRRIHEKAYGRVFLDSLPPCRRISGDTSSIAAAIERFLG